MTRRDRRALVEAAFLVAYSAAAVHDQHTTKRGKWKSGEAKALYERMLRTAQHLCRMHDRGMKA